MSATTNPIVANPNGNFTITTDPNTGLQTSYPDILSNRAYRTFTQNTSKIIHGLASATYSQTGTTVTVSCASHGLTAIYNGAEIYLVQSTGALVSGWFTNFTYVGAGSFTCTSTVSQSTSGNLGTNTAETIMASTTLQPSELGADGGVEVRTLWATNATANNKSIFAKLGAYTFYTNVVSSAATTLYAGLCGFVNRGDEAKQLSTSPSYGSGFGGVTLAASFGTIDTSISQTVNFSMQLANTADFLVLLSACIDVVKGL